MLTCLLLLALEQNGQVESKDFSMDAQATALRATIKVINLTTNHEASGVIVKQEAKAVYFLTAAHVAKPDDKLAISVFTAESYPKAAEVYKSATVLASDPQRDIAVIRLFTTDTMPRVLPLCPPKKVVDGKDFPALSVGCGDDKAPLCRVETVIRKIKVQRPGEKGTTLTWEAAIAQAKGRSGGALVDKRGFVVGIASGTNDDHGYYVHIDEINRFLKENALDQLYEEKMK
jgi:S1-C subfamily serine protease